MSLSYDVIINKHVSELNSEAQIDFKSFFSDLTKSVIARSFGDTQAGLEYGVDALKAVGLKDSPEYSAWILISKSLTRCIAALAEDYQDLLEESLDENEISLLAEQVEQTLNTVEVSLDASFFESPQKLPLLDDFKPSLRVWLMKLGMDEFQIESFHYRLKRGFVLALHEEWGRKPADYSDLVELIQTPFTKATREERSWGKYNAWLLSQANARSIW